MPLLPSPLLFLLLVAAASPTLSFPSLKIQFPSSNAVLPVTGKHSNRSPRPPLTASFLQRISSPMLRFSPQLLHLPSPAKRCIGWMQTCRHPPHRVHARLRYMSSYGWTATPSVRRLFGIMHAASQSHVTQAPPLSRPHTLLPLSALLWGKRGVV
jgi:hypothetical protein